MLVLGHVLGMEMFWLLSLSDSSTPELHGAKQHFVLLMDSGVRNSNIAGSLVFCWDLIWEDLKTGDDLVAEGWSFLESASLLCVSQDLSWPLGALHVVHPWDLSA